MVVRVERAGDAGGGRCSANRDCLGEGPPPKGTSESRPEGGEEISHVDVVKRLKRILKGEKRNPHCPAPALQLHPQSRS